MFREYRASLTQGEDAKTPIVIPGDEELAARLQEEEFAASRSIPAFTSSVVTRSSSSSRPPRASRAASSAARGAPLGSVNPITSASESSSSTSLPSMFAERRRRAPGASSSDPVLDLGSSHSSEATVDLISPSNDVVIIDEVLVRPPSRGSSSSSPYRPLPAMFAERRRRAPESLTHDDLLSLAFTHTYHGGSRHRGRGHMLAPEMLGLDPLVFESMTGAHALDSFVRFFPIQFSHIHQGPSPFFIGAERGGSFTRQFFSRMHPEIDVDNMSYEELLELGEQLGSVQPKGADETAISLLPTEKWSSSSGQELKSCLVCMEDFQEGDELRRLPCFHAFHIGCIDKWLKVNSVCPICRVDVPKSV